MYNNIVLFLGTRDQQRKLQNSFSQTNPKFKFYPKQVPQPKTDATHQRLFPPTKYKNAHNTVLTFLQSS